MNTEAQCLLWDFGDTLCDERFVFAGKPTWMTLYESFDEGLTASWCRGEIDTAAFASAVAPMLNESAEAIADHMKQRCSEIIWFPHAWKAFQSQHRAQAIVTVNPDLFSKVIVPMYKLDHYVDTIVTSWEEGTNDKAELCSIAVQRMSRCSDVSCAMLLDNQRRSVDAWIERGGMGYHFRTDEQFRVDFETEG